MNEYLRNNAMQLKENTIFSIGSYAVRKVLNNLNRSYLLFHVFFCFSLVVTQHVSLVTFDVQWFKCVFACVRGTRRPIFQQKLIKFCHLVVRCPICSPILPIWLKWFRYHLYLYLNEMLTPYVYFLGSCLFYSLLFCLDSHSMYAIKIWEKEC